MAARASGRLWAWVPALLLGGLLGTQLLVLANVLHDPGFATEPDYYQKGVDWDARQARERQSEELGWRAALGAELEPESGRARLRIELADDEGRALSGAVVRVLAFHNARAARTFDVLFTESSPGAYEAELERALPGLWELRLSVARGDDRYQRMFRSELGPLGGAR